MTAFAACLFAVTALASALAIMATLRRYGHDALALPARLAACPETLTIHWAMVERVTVPALGALRRDRVTRRRLSAEQRPGLDWPCGELAA
ncbi:hypothetical protein WBP07_03585 [Novosphingobium sp. BL-8A]|uniref:hypothetical protein n=1 Tax=Novosphingobium sp. BL-8A TaxID=3127639 RepID=UPI003756D928